MSLLGGVFLRDLLKGERAGAGVGDSTEKITFYFLSVHGLFSIHLCPERLKKLKRRKHF